MIIGDVIQNRGIIEVLHFTTHRGLLGSLHSGFVKSRKRLPSEVDLKFIYQPNAIYRKDPAWLDYVNLSISRINFVFFATSCRWHRDKDLWWCIMSFDSEVLTHPGVYFATTNNMYSGVVRGTGAAALENLFATKVVRYDRNIAIRTAQLADNLTTCVQAEALYPGELSVKYLKRVYVERNEDQDEVHAQLHMIGVSGIDVVVSAERFRP